jgi:tetratricopeptide (TPR) repeat protein
MTINPRNVASKSRFYYILTSTLTLALVLLLALTWLLSLRPVRLKIGDYYFGQGKFNQMVNWYEKVARKEKLNVDPSSHREDLTKLKYSLMRVMEEKLLMAIKLLGFKETYSIDAITQQLNKSHNPFNHISREKLQKAKEELANSNNIYNNFIDLYKKKADSMELDHLGSMGYFLKGTIDEAEDNFISADLNYEKAGTYYPQILNLFEARRNKIFPDVVDQYFCQTPLNWVNAKDFYESQVRNGKTTLNLFLNLAYIYAKFNNFSISYEYFKKAYELLKDNDLKKTIDLFKGKETFIYPDDLRLVPQTLKEKYPLIQDISFFEIKHLFSILGIKVIVKSDGFIGQTGVKSPVDIIIRSAGALVGNYGQILINGNNVSQNRRGYNVVVLNSKTGDIQNSETFDTSGSKDHVKKMIDFINGIAKGKIVCIAVFDEASNALSKEDGETFEQIGSKENLYGKNRWAHGIIGVKGSKNGEAIEAMDDKPIEIYVLNK